MDGAQFFRHSGAPRSGEPGIHGNLAALNFSAWIPDRASHVRNDEGVSR